VDRRRFDAHKGAGVLINMSPAKPIVQDYLNQIREYFYPGAEKAFFQQRTMLIKARMCSMRAFRQNLWPL